MIMSITLKQILEQLCTDSGFPRISDLNVHKNKKKHAPVTPRKPHTSQHMERRGVQLGPAFSSQCLVTSKSTYIFSVEPGITQIYVCLH